MNDWVDRARARMKALGLRHDDLAAPLGVKTRGAIGHYLNRRRSPTPSQMQALAAVLQLPMDDLFGTSDAAPYFGIADTPKTYIDHEKQAFDEIWQQLSPENRKTLAKVGNALAQQVGTEASKK